MSRGEGFHFFHFYPEIQDKLGILPIDHQIILYGAENSTFENLNWGGLSANPSMHLQNSMDIEEMDRDSEGNWRIFSATDVSSFTRNGETFNQERMNRHWNREMIQP